MSCYLTPGDYLPHDAPMLLLEEVISVTDDTATCRVTVSPDGVLAPFLDAQGNLPAWFALELMAQTVGRMVRLAPRCTSTREPFPRHGARCA
ncbi:Uncharacterised protein [Kluyvera intermedia]|nr:Uncharacterised protein [Kluyvera intermedia]